MHQTLSLGYTSAETKGCKKNNFFWQPKMGGYAPGVYTPGGYTSGITAFCKTEIKTLIISEIFLTFPI